MNVQLLHVSHIHNCNSIMLNKFLFLLSLLKQSDKIMYISLAVMFVSHYILSTLYIHFQFLCILNQYIMIHVHISSGYFKYWKCYMYQLYMVFPPPCGDLFVS